MPASGAGVTGVTPVSADVADSTWQTSFAWRVAGSDEWTSLGTAEDTTPRVFHDTAGLANGTLVEYRAISTDAAGHRAAASTYASVGNAVNLVVEEEPEPEIGLVTVPGSHNSEMGCAGDWTRLRGGEAHETGRRHLRRHVRSAGGRGTGRDQRQLEPELRREQRAGRLERHLHDRRHEADRDHWDPRTKVFSSDAEGRS